MVALLVPLYVFLPNPAVLAQSASARLAVDAPASASPSINRPESWASAIEQFSADLMTLDRRYRVPLDGSANTVRREVLELWLAKLTSDELTDQRFAELDRDAQTDCLLLRSEIEYRLAKLTIDSQRDTAAAELLPYHQPLVDFLKQREDIVELEPAAVAKQMDDTASAIELLLPALSRPSLLTADAPALASDLTGQSSDVAADQATPRRLAAWRACEILSELQRSLKEADRFYAGYDPSYNWWCAKPMERLRTALEQHRVALREHVVGISDADQETIVGLPIGADGLALELRHEWIAHSPGELVALAQR